MPLNDATTHDRELAESVVPWSRARIIDELLHMFRTKDLDIDPETGHKLSKYEKQGEFTLYRMNIYEPSPALVLYESDLQQDLHNELSSLTSDALDDVMRECIYQLLDELNVSEYKVHVRRRDIRWEIKR